MSDLTESAEVVLRTHPKLFIFVCIVAILMAGWSIRTFAEKRELRDHIQQDTAEKGDIREDLSILQDQVRNLGLQLETRFLLLDIRALESEIYQIETLDAQGEILDRDRVRLSQLRSALSEAVRTLSQLPERDQ